MKKIVFIPSVRKGNGTGHLKRCLFWAASPCYKGFVYIPENEYTEFLEKKIHDSLTAPGIGVPEIITQISGSFDAAVFDMRKTPADIAAEWQRHAAISAAVDEGGCRNSFDYLIDTFPQVSRSASPANIYSHFYAFSGYPAAEKERSDAKGGSAVKGAEAVSCKKILVSFGGEDPACITEKFLEKAVKEKLFDSFRVTVVAGPLFRNTARLKEKFSCFGILEAPSSLSGCIAESDFVFTSFGLTAYEALFAGKNVILINPGQYHRKLSKACGIAEAGIVDGNMRKIRKIMDNPARYCEKPLEIFSAEKQGRKDIADIFLSLASADAPLCPVCGKRGKVIERFEERNFMWCGSCKIAYLQQFGSTQKTYGTSYFFDEYKNQYGKTYIEDFENIAKYSAERLEIIKKYAGGKKVLDIGCAYGPFLYVMKREGYECTGIDISEDAVRHVNEKLGIKAFSVDFAGLESVKSIIPEKGFDVVTMWYVIEHFRETGKILEKCADLAGKKGIFAFSTPNFNGISSLKNRRLFLQKSPADHYTVWSIRGASKVLGRYGFRVVRVRCTGHHPERFPLIAKKLAGERLIMLFSRIFRLGDTFEIYAEKVE